MPTTQQMVRKGRRKKSRKPRRPPNALGGAPMLRGVVLLTRVLDPVKPNSADRKVARVRLSNGKEVSAIIPGRGHNVREHSIVMVVGKVTPDLRGFKYGIVRGKYDASPAGPEWNKAEQKWSVERNNARSRYGVKKGKR